jgi:hypothetical protein
MPVLLAAGYSLICKNYEKRKVSHLIHNFKVNILANSTWSGLLSYFQGIKIKRFTKW